MQDDEAQQIYIYHAKLGLATEATS